LKINLFYFSLNIFLIKLSKYDEKMMLMMMNNIKKLIVMEIKKKIERGTDYVRTFTTIKIRQNELAILEIIFRFYC
jgi:hypothetical protein